MDPITKDVDLVTRITSIEQAAKGVHSKSADLFLKDTIRIYKDRVSSWKWAEHRNKFGENSQDTYTSHLLCRVWRAKTTFSEDYAKNGLTEDLSELIGNNNPEKSIEILEKSVGIAIKIDAAQFLLSHLKDYKGPLNSKDKPVIGVHSNWGPVLKRVGAIEDSLETICIRKEKSRIRNSLAAVVVGTMYVCMRPLPLYWTLKIDVPNWTKDEFSRCYTEASKFAKKKGYDLFICDKALSDKGEERSYPDDKYWDVTFSFYNVNNAIYTWA